MTFVGFMQLLFISPTWGFPACALVAGISLSLSARKKRLI